PNLSWGCLGRVVWGAVSRRLKPGSNSRSGAYAVKRMEASAPSALWRRPMRGAAASNTFLLLGAAATAVYFVLPQKPQAVWYVVIGGASVVALVVGPRRYLTTGRTPWYLFAGGIGAWVAGDAIFDYYDVQLGREPPLPSVADVLYLAGYP